MRKPIVYIAGNITSTGDIDKNKEAFFKAERLLKGKGCEPVCTAALPTGLKEETYMAISFALIADADAVYFLDGWSWSKGAKAEKAYAEKLGIKLLFQPDDHRLSLLNDIQPRMEMG